jgi:hypothetical protein
MRKKERISIICEGCDNTFEIIPSRFGKSKYCSHKCSNNRIRTKEELDKISIASKERFINNPNLRNIVSKNGKKAMEYINENKLNFIMPKGYHTEEHKLKMKEMMSGRNVYWGEKIKENHWSKSENKADIIKKINKAKIKSVKWNSDSRKNALMNWCLEHPDKTGPKTYKKGKYISIKTNIIEYYQSGLEHKYMKLFDENDNIKHWTKRHNIILEYRYENETHKYIPDFLVEYYNSKKELIELKGRIYNQKIIDAKEMAAIEYCKQNNLEYKIIYK